MNFAEKIQVLLREQDVSNRKSLDLSDLSACSRRLYLERDQAERRPASGREITEQMVHKSLRSWLIDNLPDSEANIDVSLGVPGKWSGVIDFVVDETVIDLKIISGGQAAVLTEGRAACPSADDILEISAKYYAYQNIGAKPKGLSICYWPISKIGGREYQPWQVQVDLLPKDQVKQRMIQLDKDLSSSSLPDYAKPVQTIKGEPPRRPVLYRVSQDNNWRCKYCPFMGISCRPDNDIGEIGYYVWDNELYGWRWVTTNAGAEPAIKPPGV